MISQVFPPSPVKFVVFQESKVCLVAYFPRQHTCRCADDAVRLCQLQSVVGVNWLQSESSRACWCRQVIKVRQPFSTNMASSSHRFDKWLSCRALLSNPRPLLRSLRLLKINTLYNMETQFLDILPQSHFTRVARDVWGCDASSSVCFYERHACRKCFLWLLQRNAHPHESWFSVLTDVAGNALFFHFLITLKFIWRMEMMVVWWGNRSHQTRGWRIFFSSIN